MRVGKIYILHFKINHRARKSGSTETANGTIRAEIDAR